MVGCGEGFVYLTSSGRLTDIGLQWAMPAILAAGKGRGRVRGGGVYFFCAKAHFFSAKNIKILCIESAKTVN